MVELEPIPATLDINPIPDHRPTEEVLDKPNCREQMIYDEDVPTVHCDSSPVDPDTSVTLDHDIVNIPRTQDGTTPSTDEFQARNRRSAAVKAREKIAEWTRQLSVNLLQSFSPSAGSVADSRDSTL